MTTETQSNSAAETHQPMDETQATPAGPDVSTAPATPPAKGGALLAFIVGSIIAVALGLTLLSWALSLMFMLGLFFFMLFGLLIGSSMFRAGARSRPMPKGRVILVSALVAAVGWGTALATEAVYFPDNFVYRVLEKPKPGQPELYVPKGSYERVRSETHTFIVDYLKREHSPGGILGYMRYVMSGATIKLDLPSQARVISVEPHVSPWVWIVRVALALPLLFFTIYSVTAGLTRLASPAELRRKY